MSKRLDLRILALILVASSAAAAQLAAQDAPSVAGAARRARQQKQEASKPAKVVTNDSLPAVPQSGPAANPSESTAPRTPGDGSAPPDAAEPKKAESPEDEEMKQQEIEFLRKQIAAKQDEIATEQGMIQLAQTTYFSNPDYPRDTAGKAKIDAEKADLDRLQQEMADLKAKLEGLGATVPSRPPTKKESITPNAPPEQ